jgi:hypothetical protein
MAGQQQVSLLVRIFGILVAVQAFVASSEFWTEKLLLWRQTSVSSPEILAVVWFLLGMAALTVPKHLCRWIGIDANASVPRLEAIALQLLGLYFLTEAAAEFTHLWVQRIEFAVSLGKFRAWFDVYNRDIVNVTGAVTKALVGLMLLLRVRRVRRLIAGLRRAGRHWPLD